MPKILVQGGTRSTTEKSLCESCVYATVIQGMSQHQRLIKCGDISKMIPFNVETCNSYRRFGEMSLHEMKDMATVIDIRAGQVGFYTAEKWKEKRGAILPREYGNDYPE